MNSDSTVIELGGVVIQNVTRSTSSKDGKVLTETISPVQNPMQILEPVLVLYALFFVLLAIIIIFLGWYYIKKRAETAKLMVQNNMSPGGLYRSGAGEGKSISNFLKFGIILIALAVALFFDALLSSMRLYKYSGPVFMLCFGAALICIHVLNSRKK